MPDYRQLAQIACSGCVVSPFLECRQTRSRKIDRAFLKGRVSFPVCRRRAGLLNSESVIESVRWALPTLTFTYGGSAGGNQRIAKMPDTSGTGEAGHWKLRYPPLSCRTAMRPLGARSLATGLVRGDAHGDTAAQNQ